MAPRGKSPALALGGACINAVVTRTWPRDKGGGRRRQEAGQEKAAEEEVK